LSCEHKLITVLTEGSFSRHFIGGSIASSFLFISELSHQSFSLMVSTKKSLSQYLKAICWLRLYSANGGPSSILFIALVIVLVELINCTLSIQGTRLCRTVSCMWRCQLLMAMNIISLVWHSLLLFINYFHIWQFSKTVVHPYINMIE